MLHTRTSHLGLSNLSLHDCSDHTSLKVLELVASPAALSLNTLRSCLASCNTLSPISLGCARCCCSPRVSPRPPLSSESVVLIRFPPLCHTRGPFPLHTHAYARLGTLVADPRLPLVLLNLRSLQKPSSNRPSHAATATSSPPERIQSKGDALRRTHRLYNFDSRSRGVRGG
ncbi:hypothetical protein BJY59DRAFT_695715, partial [Rhodotorula toruloides]